MRLRMVSIDEYQFLTCFKYSLWGSRRDRFRDWRKSDYLIFLVDKAFSGIAVIAGEPFFSKEKVWDNDTFPYRIPIEFNHIIEKDKRPRILGPVRETIIKAWGPKFGLGILNQRVLEDILAEPVLDTISSTSNSINFYKENIESLLIEAKNERELAMSKKKPTRRKISNLDEVAEDYIEPEESLHSKTQQSLIKLGKVTGCLSWVALNDRGKALQDKLVNECCLKNLPKMGLDEEANRRISLIDVIWFKGNVPICAFEIETTTSIYSGILRMSDLMSVVTATNIKLFVVAPKERENRVRSEIIRPTFKKIGLSDYCKFISVEDLDELYKKVEGFLGYVQPSIIDKIAISFEEKNHF